MRRRFDCRRPRTGPERTLSGSLPERDRTELEVRRRIWRAFLGRCPNCGDGRLFRTYLNQVDRCAACGEAFGHIRADDAPPWLTILVVGHLVVPTMLLVESVAPWPLCASSAIWPLVTVALALVLLPRCKGVFLAIIWATNAPGAERSASSGFESHSASAIEAGQPLANQNDPI